MLPEYVSSYSAFWSTDYFNCDEDFEQVLSDLCQEFEDIGIVCEGFADESKADLYAQYYSIARKLSKKFICVVEFSPALNKVTTKKLFKERMRYPFDTCMCIVFLFFSQFLQKFL